LPAVTEARADAVPGRPSPGGGSLGTFAGVFTPSILTILGIILFLRAGYVVGAAGLPRALIIILAANAISVLTSVSLSAIATNLRVKGGGDYYLISRTLGVEYGGALGLVLFLAQAVSIAFYAIGFAEAIVGLTPLDPGLATRVVAGVAVALLFVLAWLGADWATKFQYVVMAVLAAALVAFFIGGIGAANGEQLRANLAPSAEVPFWVLFAIFFPAVTGFTQGVSMSGDLRDPGRSLPRGTFAAVFLSFAVYVGVAFVFAAALPGADLVADYASMRRVSAVAWLVDAGVIAATLSSAMASFLGAPRILQSLAADKVFPLLTPFAAGYGESNNPRRGVLLAAAIAYLTIGLGNLNAIASVVSMFFLISYGLLNYATFFEARANSPSFRPRFGFFSARLSLAGAVGCLGAMLAISPLAGALAVVVLFILYQYVSRSVSVERWADSSRSHRLQRVRDDLHAIGAELEHPRDWRPVILAFSDNPKRRERLTLFASWLEGGAGFTTVVRIVEAAGAAGRRERERSEKELGQEIRRRELDAFVRVVVTESVEQAVPVILQSYGLGRVHANTVILNWYDRDDTEESPGLKAYLDHVRMALRFDANVVLLAARQADFEAMERVPPDERVIDVWYEENASGRLMLLLAYLLTRSEPFSDAKIRLLTAAAPDETYAQATARLAAMLEEARIEAVPEVVAHPSPETVISQSKSSTIVFQEARLKGGELCSSFEGDLEAVVKELGTTALVLASQDLALDSEPEGGRHAEIAEASDAADKARKVAEDAEKTAAEATKVAGEARNELAAAAGNPIRMSELEQVAKRAEEDAEKARRRAARARAKADDAASVASRLRGESEAGDGSSEAE
jgi:amino acid transporter